MKTKRVTYKDLRDCYYFKHDGRVYLKVASSHSLDARTDKDAIFAPYEKVEPLGPAACDLV